MSYSPIDSFVEAYVQSLHDQNATVFAGAGLSIPAGLVDWKGLLKNIARDVFFAIGERIPLFQGIVGRLQPILSKLPRRFEEVTTRQPRGPRGGTAKISRRDRRGGGAPRRSSTRLGQGGSG